MPDRGRRRAVRRTSGRGAAGDRVSDQGGRRRLALEFPGRTWPVLAYRPSLATFVGPNAMGVMVFEGEGEPEGPHVAQSGRLRDEEPRPRKAKG